MRIRVNQIVASGCLVAGEGKGKKDPGRLVAPERKRENRWQIARYCQGRHGKVCWLG